MIPQHNIGIGSWPARRARISPDRVALSQGLRSLSYAQLADRCRRLATVLAEVGVGPGDRVAYLGANDPATFETFFAAGLLGAVFVPLNTRLSPPEIQYLLGDCVPTVLVQTRATAELARSAGPWPHQLRAVLTVRPAGDQVVGPAEGSDHDHDHDHDHDYESRIAAAEPRPEPAAVGLDDAALILYTSGTTGRPKGAVLTHGNLTWNTMNQLAHVDVASTDRALCIAPLFHVVGLGQVTLPTLFKGGSVEVLPAFDAGTILELIHTRGITSFSAVPTMLQMLCEHPGWEPADLSSLTCVIYGGSPVQERVARAWLARGVQVVQGYGMTEAAPGVYMAVHEGSLQRPVSIGLPHFFTDVAHFDGAEVVPIRPEIPAELVIRGPNVFAGYWQRPRDAADGLLADGWFRTGDVVRVADDGWAYAVDRVKDMIISGGENIYPAEIEAVAVQLDDVAGCAVVAVPDDRWGEVGAAFVQLRPGAELTVDGLRAHLAANLARFKIPKYVHLVDDLPRNATGKLRRAALRDLAAGAVAGTGTEGNA